MLAVVVVDCYSYCMHLASLLMFSFVSINRINLSDAFSLVLQRTFQLCRLKSKYYCRYSSMCIYVYVRIYTVTHGRCIRTYVIYSRFG